MAVNFQTDADTSTYLDDEEVIVSRSIQAGTDNANLPSDQSMKDVWGSSQIHFQYPDIRREDSFEFYYDKKIYDPYHWLETPDSDETQMFVDEQNNLAESYLDKSSWRDAIRAKLTEMWDFKKSQCPKQVGSRFFSLKTVGLQNQPILCMQESLDTESRVLVDPNELSVDGLASIADFAVSPNGEYAAYGLSEHGSEWSSIYVKNVSTGQNFLEVLTHVKPFSVQWTNDNRGFFYPRFPRAKARRSLANDLYSANQHQKLFYHRIGTRQDDDVPIVEFSEYPGWAVSSSISLDGRYLFISAGDTIGEQHSFYMDLGMRGLVTRAIPKLVLFPEPGHHTYLANDETTMYFLTDLYSPNYQVISFDITGSRTKADWNVIVEENPTAIVIWACVVAVDKLAVCYNEHMETRLEIRKFADGELLKAIVFEDNISGTDFHGRRDLSDLFVKVESYLNPGIIYRLKFDGHDNVESEVYSRTEIPYYDPDHFTSELVFYSNDDGTNVPMTLIHRNGIELNGATPCILYGHGGSRKSLFPEFHVPYILFAQNFDGVMAIANIRGGGEYGKAWWDDGRLLHKQNAIEDFIAAANFLVNNKYCRSSRLAIMGTGHGGTTVAATINKRPDLFGAAICEAGVMDLLRFPKFTLGCMWVSEYGNINEYEELSNILSYSPLHNIVGPTSSSPQYPAVFVTSADHDDRVVPCHSYKYIAELQYTVGRTMTQYNPLLLRVYQNIGHGSGTPTMKLIEKATDIFCFLENAMGFEFHF